MVVRNQDKLNQLLPSLQQRANNAIQKSAEVAKKLGYTIGVGDVYRDPLHQTAWWLCGRAKNTDDVMRYFDASSIGFRPTVGQANSIMTNALPGMSLHEQRRALDILLWQDGKMVDPKRQDMRDDLTKITMPFRMDGWDCGIDWGQMYDPAHVEFRGPA